MIEKSNPFFSQRHGLGRPEPEITVMHDAPRFIRRGIIDVIMSRGMSLSEIKYIICGVLDEENEISYGRSDTTDQIINLMMNAEWYEVYDICEKLFDGYSELEDKRRDYSGSALEYQKSLNRFFVKNGVGWLMQDGRLLARTSEVFSKAIADAAKDASEGGHNSAAKELHEALTDISRRPEPDVTGAIQHAMAALECVAREVSGEKGTLGAIAKDLGLPPPLGDAMVKLWGFASERGRHLQNGREPSFPEAALVVTVSAALVTYLIKKVD
jgi:hypothetical protein